jgi:hypothetical protein
MSHIVTIATELRNIDTIKEVCRRLNLQCRESKNIEIYSTTKSGIGVYLNGWKYPVVIDSQGKVYYDNFGGNWGNEKEWDKFVNEYSLEETLKKIKMKNLRYNVQRDRDEIRIEVIV